MINICFCVTSFFFPPFSMSHLIQKMKTNLKEILKISSLTRSEFGNMAKRILCIVLACFVLYGCLIIILYEMSFIEKPCQKSCHGQFVLFRYIFLCKINIINRQKKVGNKNQNQCKHI
jgi:hypothetical protein